MFSREALAIFLMPNPKRKALVKREMFKMIQLARMLKMGFNKVQATQALIKCGYEIHLAINLLCQQEPEQEIEQQPPIAMTRCTSVEAFEA